MEMAVESVPVKCGGSVKSGRPDKSWVPAKSGGPLETVAAMASAAMTTPGWYCGNDQEGEREKGRYNCPTHTTFTSLTEHRPQSSRASTRGVGGQGAVGSGGHGMNVARSGSGLMSPETTVRRYRQQTTRAS